MEKKTSAKDRVISHKVGPGSSYKWDEITPVSRAITPVAHFRPF